MLRDYCMLVLWGAECWTKLDVVAVLEPTDQLGERNSKKDQDSPRGKISSQGTYSQFKDPGFYS